jgi:hypothetical protein
MQRVGISPTFNRLFYDGNVVVVFVWQTMWTKYRKNERQRNTIWQRIKYIK